MSSDTLATFRSLIKTQDGVSSQHQISNGKLGSTSASHFLLLLYSPIVTKCSVISSCRCQTMIPSLKWAKKKLYGLIAVTFEHGFPRLPKLCRVTQLSILIPKYVVQDFLLLLTSGLMTENPRKKTWFDF